MQAFVPTKPPTVAISILVMAETGPMAPYGLLEVLHVAGGPGAVKGVAACFVPRIVARTGEPFMTSFGVPLTPQRSITEDEDAGLIVICDAELQPGESPEGRWGPEIDWLRRRFEDGAMICSTCSGALVLAEAGLLDGQDAASHWATAALFRDHYPAVRFRPERILCDSGHAGRLVTTGGASSWQDLALYLIGRFCGAAEAARVARLFVIGERSEGQLPFASMSAPRRHEDAVIAEVQAWVANHYDRSNPVTGMTEVSGLHERTFKRRFRQATGYAPLDYVHALRVDEAKQMLEASDVSVETVAAKVGYADPANFSRLFRRLAGVTPAQWRRRFSPRPVMRLASRRPSHSHSIVPGGFDV